MVSRGTTALKIVVLGEGKFFCSTAPKLLLGKTSLRLQRAGVKTNWDLPSKPWIESIRAGQGLDRKKGGKRLDWSDAEFVCLRLLCTARVGKTSLSTKFVHGQFDKQQSSTVDASFLEKTVQVGEKRVKLVIWDTAGQEKYHALAKNYY